MIKNRFINEINRIDASYLFLFKGWPAFYSYGYTKKAFFYF